MANPTHLEHIGKNIKELRKYRELTQQELAEAAGVRLATISEIEAGKANFQFNTLVRIATALNCYLDISFTPAAADMTKDVRISSYRSAALRSGGF